MWLLLTDQDAAVRGTATPGISVPKSSWLKYELEKAQVNAEEGKNKRFIFQNYVSGGLGKEKEACKE